MGADEFVANPADFNEDGIVDYFDIVVLVDQWLVAGSGLKSDLYQDGFVDFADFNVFAAQWLWKAGWHQ